MNATACRVVNGFLRNRLHVASLTAALLLSAPAALAGITSQMQQTNQPGAFTYPDAPAGFVAAQASDAELTRWGFPPRPTEAGALARWTQAVSTARHHIAAPLLQRNTTNRHSAARVASAPAQATAPADGTTGPNYQSYSTNWSGYVLANDYVWTESGPYPAPYTLSPPSSFGPSAFWMVSGSWTVPVARPARDTCAGTLYSSQWVGIDGYVQSSDVLQAGTEADSTCKDGVNTPTYFAWYEWAPAGTIVVQNLPIVAGDAVQVWVWNDDPTHGHAYIENIATGDYVTLALTAPPGVQLTGDTAEWIVESPTGGAGFNDGVSIPNYGQTVMVGASATTHDGKAFSPGTQGVQSLINVSLCDATCHGELSAATLAGPAAVQFTATGQAVDSNQ
jgi:hypothetical protein